MIVADGCLIVVCRGRVMEKGRAVFQNDKGGEDVSFRIVLAFLGGKRTLYFDTEEELNAVPVKVGDRVDAVGEANEGKAGKVYMRNVSWLKTGTLADRMDEIFAGLAAPRAPRPPQ